MPKRHASAIAAALLGGLQRARNALTELNATRVRVAAAAVAGTAALTVGVVIVMFSIVRTDAPPAGDDETVFAVPPTQELRVPDWQLPDSTEVLLPPILLLRSESGSWSRSEIEPFMYDTIDAVREHLRRENEAALRRVFARVP